MRRVRRPLLALVALALAAAIGYGVNAVRSDGSGTGPDASQSTGLPAGGAPLSALPVQARRTVRLIEQGGPFPYPHNDGVVFHNDGAVLPIEPDGYYHEYTVPTTGAPDRGTRRIVTGAAGQYFYTADHYEHFVWVDVNR